jgi:CheY-like chemotaxis protein
MVLSQVGYVVLEAVDGTEALALWKARRGEIDLLYTDMVMPGAVSGLKLAEQVLADKPGLKVIITSGYSTDSVDASPVAESAIVYLFKPCPPATLLSVIRKCFHPGA